MNIIFGSTPELFKIYSLLIKPSTQQNRADRHTFDFLDTDHRFRWPMNDFFFNSKHLLLQIVQKEITYECDTCILVIKI